MSHWGRIFTHPREDINVPPGPALKKRVAVVDLYVGKKHKEDFKAEATRRTTRQQKLQ